MGKTTPSPRTDALRAELRSRGLRATTARLAILRALRQAHGPVSHGEMQGLLDEHGWDRTTLYRNLVELAKAGLAVRNDLGDHTWRFEAVLDPGAESAFSHPHFVCGSCGTIACLDGVSLKVERAGPLAKALKERDVQIQVRGTCDSCV